MFAFEVYIIIYIHLHCGVAYENLKIYMLK